ncbi:MAG: hypothetical protein P4L87_25055 [Formivibrio sp.]|nr:hypothetical protein [Formivibrio sp.]
MTQEVTLKVGEATITLPATSIVKQILETICQQAVKPASVAAPTRPTLADGEHYAGIILGEDGAADYHLILLPESIEDIKWQAAKDWAAEQGGELPTRREQSLLYANLKKHFKPRWHWSCEEHPTEARYAFVQTFDGGGQNGDVKGYEYCARAVRRVSVI